MLRIIYTVSSERYEKVYNKNSKSSFPIKNVLK